MGKLGIYLGQQVKRLRVERGLSQANLADIAGTSEEWIRRIEHGARSPSFDTLEALSRALDVSVAKLFAGFDDDASGGREGLIAETEGLTRDQIKWLEDAARLLRRAPS